MPGTLFVAAHLEWMRQRGLAESTIIKRRQALARLTAYLGKHPFEATAADLAAWRASLRPGDDAIATYVSHVRMYFRWLHAEELLDADPAAQLVMPRLAERLPRPIPEDRLLAALEAAGDRIRPMLVLAGWCGLRAREIALLRRDRVYETRTPPVLLVAAGATKGKRERYVPLCDFALAELVPVLPASGWVFRRARGHGPMTPDWVSHLCNRFLHDAGLAETLHTLRHRFATAALDGGSNVRTVQELLGHRHLSTTAIYTRVSPPAAYAAVQALPAPRHLAAVSQSTENAV